VQDPSLPELALTILTIDFLRYALTAGAVWLLVGPLLGRRLAGRRILQAACRPGQLRREFVYSLSTVVIFAANGVLVWLLAANGTVEIYTDVAKRGWAWWWASVALIIIAHDAYFYWTHRAMHHPALFRRVHRVHHLSHNPSPWAAYAFAPAEALVHALFVPLCLLVMPIHQYALFAFLAFMIVRNVLGHLGIELFPAWFVHRRISRWSTTTTHHGLHHARVRTNFGLYFTWWDRAMGTTDPTYEAAFAALLGADQLRVEVRDLVVARVDVGRERPLRIAAP